MILPHFNALQTLIETGLNSIKKIDWYNGQYNRYKDVKAVPFPNCLIEFPDEIDWRAGGNGVQFADIDIRLHLVVFDLNDNPVSIYQLASEVYKFINNKVLLDGIEQLSTELVRNRSTKITPDDQIKVMILSFGTNISDVSGCADTIPVNAQFIIK